jgi:signal transduction histidine kinase/DNA-binding response OmpR family regulator
MSGTSFIRNYPSSEYLEHEQNWSIIRDRRGLLYSANGNGILEYDGVAWRLIITNPEGRARSLACDAGGTIYVGGSGTFGYLAPDSTGQMRFMSLLNYVTEQDRQFGEVWRTHSAHDGVYFQTFNKLFRWANNRVTVWNAEPFFFLSYVVDDTLIISQRNTGLFKVVGDSLHMLPGSQPIAEQPIYEILPYDSLTLMICARNGLFLHRGGALTPLPTEAEEVVFNHAFSSAAALPNGLIALATYDNGVAIIDRRGALQSVLNKESGLQSNDVKSFYYDLKGSLWLALNEGIAQIKMTSGFSHFTDLQGLRGAVTAVLRHHGALYAATSQGIFYLDARQKNRPAFNRIDGVNRDSYALLSAGRFLLAGTNGGLFALDARQAKLISPEETVFSLHRSRRDSTVVFVGLISGLGVARYEKNRWRYAGKIDDVTEEVRSIAEQPDGTIWLGTIQRGVLRLEFDDLNQALPKARVERLAREVLLPYGQVCIVNKRLVFATEKGLKSIDMKSRAILPDSTLTASLSDTSLSIHNLFEINNGNVLVVLNRRGEKTGEAWLAKPGRSSVLELDKSTFREVLSLGAINASFIDFDNSVLFGCNRGVIRYDPSILPNLDVQFPPLIRRVTTVNGDSLIFGGTSSPSFKDPTVSYRDNALKFEFAIPSFDRAEANQYQYRLDDFDDGWSPWTNEARKDYTNLPEGEYTFRLRARNLYHRVSDEVGFRLQVQAPWYRSWFAYLIYATLAGFAVFGLVRIRVHQLRLRTRHLEALVEERTVTIRQQAEKLRELDQMKSRFFANISHEFRTPLTLILGPLEDLIGRMSNKSANHELRVIERNARRLLRLINQLLDLSRLESGRMTLHASGDDFAAFLRSIVMSFASLAEQKRIKLEFRSGEPMKRLRNVYFDRDKIEKIFYNLIGNAFKFTPAGGTVTVEVARNIAFNPPSKGDIMNSILEGDVIEVRVTDTGIGIPAERLPYIFDRFYQVDSTHTHEHEGTGIGLALTKELVERHYGTISVRSDAGKGAEFVVSLPVGKEHFHENEIVDEEEATFEEREVLIRDEGSLAASSIEPAVHHHIATSDSPQVEATQNDLDLILVVDDHADMRHYIRRHLEPGYQVIEAQHGNEGVETAFDAVPDLVISDVMMPQRDGYQLCEALKTDERTSHIPVILLTAKAGEQSKLAGLETGADDYLVKPFNSRELQLRVRNLIEQRHKLRERYRREGLLQPRAVAATSIEEAFIQKLMDVLEAHLADENFGVEKLGEALHIGRRQLLRKIRALTGQAPVEFIRAVRLQRARQLLEQHAGTVSEVAYQTGFNNLSHFAKWFREEFGVLPSEVLRKG